MKTTPGGYEPVPKRPDPNCLCAPEHYHVAVHMRRYKGELIIERHSIFKYSEENPPAFLAGNIRPIRRR